MEDLSTIIERESFFNEFRKKLFSKYYNPEDLLIGGRENILKVFVDESTTNEFRGYLCELFFEIVLIYMKHELSKEGIESEYISDIIIPSFLGGSQLDLVFVTQSNIYCIECKSIFGKMIIKNGEIISVNRGTISKPWDQNKTHIYALKKILEMNKEYVYNIVGLFSLGLIEEISLNKNEFLLNPTNAAKVMYSIETQSKNKKFAPQKIIKYLKRFKATEEGKYEHNKRLRSMMK